MKKTENSVTFKLENSIVLFNLEYPTDKSRKIPDLPEGLTKNYDIGR